jgi:ElaB/YqjD/DUF883 family membrane-anchored ribosome-binding protein
MADEKLLTADGDDDIEVVEVAELPTGDPAPKAEPEEEDDRAAASDDEDDDEEDTRLADEDDDDADEDPKRRKRVKRRQIQKAAKERTLQELQMLRRANEDLMRRVAAVEGASLTHSTTQIDQRLAEVQRDVRLADQILAKAIEAGNGTDAAEALRLRDEAKAAERELTNTKTSITTRRDTPAAPDPRVVNYAEQWKQANPWYDNNGRDEDSAVVNAIDNRLASEGYDPASQDYWSELTRRVKARIGANDDRAAPAARDKRKAPPQGVAREHAPTSTRTEVYVTPERKAAMIDAGVWDDPVKRNQMLKAYQKYDRENRSAG